MTGALEGIKVVDMTGVGMGPYATQMLGDMGADVIKVETADGDVFRHATPMRHPAMSHAYLNFNRNKRSIVLDARTELGREAMKRLVQGADVFVSNVRSAGLTRLGLDYDTLKKLNPRLIYCGCYGYSEKGPYGGRPAIDDTIQAASGIAWLQGVNRDAPQFVQTVVADKSLSLFVAHAITTALFARERTGKGQAIEVPMFECMAAFVTAEHMGGLAFDPPLGKPGYSRLLDPFRKPFRTKDGYMCVVPYTNAQWRRFFTLAGRPELADDPRFKELVDRSRNFTALYSFVEEVVATRSSEEWNSVLAEADIPFAKVNSIEDLVNDPHLRAVGFWQEYEHPTEGRIRTAGIPVNYSETPGTIRRPAPGLGEHTDEILRELGLKA